MQVLSLLMAPVADNIWLMDYVWQQYRVGSGAEPHAQISSTPVPRCWKCSTSRRCSALRSV